MNKRGFAVALVVAIIAVVLVAVGGVWYYRAHQVSQTNAVPENSTTAQTQATSSALVSNSSSSDQSASSTVFITPTSGPAGTMVAVHGNLSVCGGDSEVGTCTEDRFNVPLFVRAGESIPENSAMNLSLTYQDDNHLVYQVPTSSTPGNYEFVMQNCLGKDGCGETPLGNFIVTTNNLSAIPSIDFISPRSITSTSVITIHGNNFTVNNNYIRFDGTDTNRNDGMTMVAASSDGKTITLQLPTSSCSFSFCFQYQESSYSIAVSNASGTSNIATLFTPESAVGSYFDSLQAGIIGPIPSWSIGQRVSIQWKTQPAYFTIMLVPDNVFFVNGSMNDSTSSSAGNEFVIANGSSSSFTVVTKGDPKSWEAPDDLFSYDYTIPSTLSPGMYSVLIHEGDKEDASFWGAMGLSYISISAATPE